MGWGGDMRQQSKGAFKRRIGSNHFQPPAMPPRWCHATPQLAALGLNSSREFSKVLTPPIRVMGSKVCVGREAGTPTGLGIQPCKPLPFILDTLQLVVPARCCLPTAFQPPATAFAITPKTPPWPHSPSSAFPKEGGWHLHRPIGTATRKWRSSMRHHTPPSLVGRNTLHVGFHGPAFVPGHP